jgi:hypothetical protein
MQPRGYTCLGTVEPLTIEIQLAADGLWMMHLFDERGRFRVIMPPSEYGLDAAKEKALVNAEFYMRKYGGDGSWRHPASIVWQEFAPRSVVWET